VTKTLLAVDDSATMRKVLEITFGGDEFRVVTADSAQAALGKLSEEPKVFVIDTVLGGDDGYALSKEVRRRDGSAVIVLLSSRHNPYDQAKGTDAGADDFMDKPFDTQQMADKVRKAVAAREAGGAARAPVAAAAAAPAARPAVAPVPAPVAAAAAPPPPKPPAGRAATLMFGGDGMSVKAPTGAQPSAAPAPPKPAPVAASPVSAAPAPQASRVPAPAAAAPSPQPPKVAPAPAAVATRATASVNGHLTDKLAGLGLTQQQVEAVLALSRDVIERVVWEVVPDLAETLIKEEITRLTKA